MFCVYLRTNSHLCHLQHKLIGFNNRDEKFLLRGTNWVFKYSSLRFVFNIYIYPSIEENIIKFFIKQINPFVYYLLRYDLTLTNNIEIHSLNFEGIFFVLPKMRLHGIFVDCNCNKTYVRLCLDVKCNGSNEVMCILSPCTLL